jgi:hypothetical protein
MLLSCQSHCGPASVTTRQRGPSRIVTEGAHLLARVPVKVETAQRVPHFTRMTPEYLGEVERRD